MTLPRTPIPPEKMSTLGATGNWMQPGEQTTAQTSHQTSGGDPISQPLPPPPQMAQQLEEQEILRSLQAKAKEEGTDKDEHAFVEFVDFIIDNVSKTVDSVLWEKEAQQLLQPLETTLELPSSSTLITLTKRTSSICEETVGSKS